MRYGVSKRAHDPLDHFAGGLELVAVDLHADHLVLGPQLVEQIGIELGREHEASTILGHVAIERIDERRLVRHLLGQDVRGMAEVRRNLEGQLPVGAEGGAHAGQQVQMIVDPLQRGIGEDELQALAEPGRDVALLERQSFDVAVRGLGALEHGGRGVDTHCFLGVHLLVEDLRQVPGPATQIDHLSTRHGMTQHQQVVERLLALRAETLVLIRVPPVNRSQCHRSHV